ncbi:heavy metal translocating P-type ATPase [Brachybacterium sp. DNPG3]
MSRFLRGPWRVPAVAGLLILASAALSLAAGTNPFGGGHGELGLALDRPLPLVLADLLMIAAAVVAGAPILVAAVRALRVRTVGIDLLVSVAALGALVVGEHWEAAAVTFLFAVGHALEARTMDRTRSALAELVAVAPDLAVVLEDGRQREVPAAEVRPGQTVLVKNGAKAPVDGIVRGGAGALDEASITGESIPVEKGVGDRVFAGTVSTGGLLQVEAVDVGASTTLARIIRRVEEAQDATARTQSFLERFSAWYTPGIIVLALVAGLLTGDVVLALTLLVIGCPGALVISIPVAIVAGIGRGARDGLLIKGGEHLETSARIDAVALDKTGTLTEGRPRLTDVIVLDPAVDRDEVLLWAARAEAGSEHPLARPVLEAADEAGLRVVGLPESTEPVPGRGILATIDGRRVAVGTLGLLAVAEATGPVGAAGPSADGAPAAGSADLDRARHEAERLAEAGRTPMIVAVDSRPIGVLGVADRLRPEAAEMVRRLRAVGVDRVVMLTGDARPVAEAVAREVGIDEVRAELLPEDKLAAVRGLRADGRTVAMVGDGVNDAPALATADIGIAMGAAGSGVAIETADIALMADDLRALPAAIGLARRTVAVMRQNIVIALVTVVALLAGVMLGGVTMAIGMLVHEASVLLVIANGMRLLRPRTTPTR